MRSVTSSVVALAVQFAAAGCDHSDESVEPRPPASRRWSLTWSDEFSGPRGSAPDSTKWTHDVGSHTWWGDSLQYYTDGSANAVVADGFLAITATDVGAASYTCWYGPCRYTSARIATRGRFVQQYGRFAARIKIPVGAGLWPAFWMLGEDLDVNGWPACGEIDIMENLGREPSINHATLLGPGYAPVGISATFELPSSRLGDEFHTYALEWEPGTLRFFIDDVMYKEFTPADVGTGGWPFDHPFFILLNVNIGGSWAREPDATTTFPQSMLVDWVRVYSAT